MKNILLFSFALFLLLLSASAQRVEVISFNIRYNSPHDGINLWDKRKEGVVDLLSYYQPAIVGLQEATHSQLLYIDSAMSKYRYVGVGRDDGEKKGEYSPILIDTNLFRIETQSTFWLSAESENVSVGWDASMERICTYALLEHKITKRKLWVFNTHFDHIGEVAREMSAKLILANIQHLNKEDLPVILMGDFNARPEDKPIQTLQAALKDGATISRTPSYGPVGTFNGFNPEMKLDARIDYIFVSKILVMSYAHIDDKLPNGNFVSDHLPVLIKGYF